MHKTIKLTGIDCSIDKTTYRFTDLYGDEYEWVKPEFDIKYHRSKLPFLKDNKIGGGIKKVIFNDPATIVFWNSGEKTEVKCSGEEFDKEKGLLCCIVKYICGNDNSYHRLFKDWIN